MQGYVITLYVYSYLYSLLHIIFYDIYYICVVVEKALLYIKYN